MTARTDRAARLIRAPAAALYRALIDPDALVEWLPPVGMRGELLAFDARQGGGYRMRLAYQNRPEGVRGKSSDDADLVDVRFVELRPDRSIVQSVTFDSDDPAFAGEMQVTWALRPAGEATEVAVTCENVPEGISAADHAAGLAASLSNLAALVERPAS
jgi:uncharacterized protein YndB with AHSA1/START domain